MSATTQAVQPQVTLSPLQVGTRHINRRGATRTAQSGMNAGTAGVGEQVKEILTFTHLAQHAARNTVIEEQTGIKIVCQVDPQARVVLAYLNEFTLLIHLLILVLPFLALTGFQHQFIWRDFQDRQRCGNDIEQTLTCFLRIDRLRRSVFLNHDPLTVTVHCNVVFRQVSIIQAIAFNSFLTSPFFQLLDILAQAIGIIFRDRGWLAVRSGLCNVIVFLYAIQRTVFRFELLISTQLQAAEQIRRGTEQRQVPAAKLVFHRTAQQAMQGNQRRFAIQTFAVGRVTDHRTIRSLRQWITQFGDIFNVKCHQIGNTCAAGVTTRFFNHARIAVGAIEVRSIVSKPLTRTHLSFGFNLLPDGFIVLCPTAKAPVPAMQARRAIGCPHRRFNQQRAGAAHRIE